MPTVVSWVFSSTDPARAAPVDKLKQESSSPLAESSNFEADLSITTQTSIIRLSDGLSFATSSGVARRFEWHASFCDLIRVVSLAKCLNRSDVARYRPLSCKPFRRPLGRLRANFELCQVARDTASLASAPLIDKQAGNLEVGVELGNGEVQVWQLVRQA